MGQIDQVGNLAPEVQRDSGTPEPTEKSKSLSALIS